jgi:hypothetical protein
MGKRENEKGEWFGFDIENPSDGEAWVGEESYGKLKEAHLFFSAAHAEKRLQVVYDEDEPRGAAAVEESKEF